MNIAKMDLSGLVSTTRVVHGVELRGLNFADLSAQWQTNGTRLIDAYEDIIKAGADLDDMFGLANTIIKHAPDLARAAFLASINDKGDKHQIGDEELTAGEIWDTKMAIGKQADVIIAILELTLSETDNLQKKIQEFGSKHQTAQQQTSLAQTVLGTITQ